MSYEMILFETQGPVAVVTINRPKAMNALSPQVVDEIDHAMKAVMAETKAAVSGQRVSAMIKEKLK